MRKILFLINDLGNGGAEKVLVNLVNNMNKREYKITVKTLFDYGINKKRLSKDIKYEFVLKNHFKGSNIILDLLPKKIFSKYIVNGDYDIIVVYLHGILTKIISKYKEKDVKKIAWIHANMNNSCFLNNFKNKKHINSCFKNYEYIVGVSSEVSESFVKKVGFSDKVITKYNTFNVNEIEKLACEKINENIFSDSYINMCSVGKLEEVKGYDRLLKVLKKLIDENYKFKLNIIGTGPEEKKLRKFIYKNNMEKYINLIGVKENPYKYIKKSDLLICSSRSEGFSSVVVEAVILGRAILTTECAGMKGILGDNNQYGIIVNNSTEGLYCGLKEILDNNYLIKEYQNRSLSRKSFFSIKKSVEEVEKIF